MDFEFEDLDVEVTKNDEDTEMDVAVADGEATIAIENSLVLGNRIIGIIDNINMAIENVDKFGLTKANLHLLNKNNKLGRAAGLTLPTFESDGEDQFTDVDIDESDAVIAVEGLGNSLSNAKKAVVEWFKKMIDAITNFFKARWGKAVRLEKRLNALKAKFKKTVNFDKIGGMEIETFKYKDAMEGLMHLSIALKELKGITVENAADKFKGDTVSKINGGLAYVGLQLKSDDKDEDTGAEIDYKIEAADDDKLKLEKEKGKLTELGWSYGAMDKAISGLITTVKEAAKGDAIITTLKKAQAKATKAADSTADAAAKKADDYKTKADAAEGDDKKAAADALADTYGKESKAASKASKELVAISTVIIKAVTKITDAMFTIVDTFCTIGEKIPTKD